MGKFGSAVDVNARLDQLVNGPQALSNYSTSVHGSEHVDLCVRFSIFSDFFAQHSARIVRHILADVRFCYFVRHAGQVPRKFNDASHDMCPIVNEEDILNDEKTNGSVKIFLPESPSHNRHGPNWMYMYDKVKDLSVVAARTGAHVQILRPDDEWHAADLVEEARLQLDAIPSVLSSCASVRQHIDFHLFRLPRQQPLVLECELQGIATAAMNPHLPAVQELRGQIDMVILNRWASNLVVLRCKALKFELWRTDFCVVCGMETKFQCSHCKRDQYCSEDCQWDAWQNGHKWSCSGLSHMKTGHSAQMDGVQPPGTCNFSDAATLMFESVD